MLAVLQWTLVAGWGGCILFALAVGQRCERLGAGICLGGALLTACAQIVSLKLLNDYYPTTAFAGVYIATSVAFAALALRYPEKLWPGVAGCFQFLVCMFSVSRQVNFPLDDQALVALSNVSALGVTTTLAVGSYLARWGKPRYDEWEEFAAKLDQGGPKS